MNKRFKESKHPFSLLLVFSWYFFSTQLYFWIEIYVFPGYMDSFIKEKDRKTYRHSKCRVAMYMCACMRGWVYMCVFVCDRYVCTSILNMPSELFWNSYWLLMITPFFSSAFKQKYMLSSFARPGYFYCFSSLFHFSQFMYYFLSPFPYRKADADVYKLTWSCVACSIPFSKQDTCRPDHPSLEK